MKTKILKVKEWLSRIKNRPNLDKIQLIKSNGILMQKSLREIMALKKPHK